MVTDFDIFPRFGVILPRNLFRPCDNSFARLMAMSHPTPTETLLQNSSLKILLKMNFMSVLHANGPLSGYLELFPLLTEDMKTIR